MTDGVMEEKWLAASGVLKCLCFKEKSTRGMPILERERSTHGISWFPRGGVIGGCSDAAAACDYRSQATSRLTRGDRQPVGLKDFVSDIVVEIKQTLKIEWVEKERFFGKKKIMDTNLGCRSLNKKFKLLNLKYGRLKSNQALTYF
jgi:hypothetical protein